MEQTAVEWLVEQLATIRKQNSGYRNIKAEFKEIIEQAKAMEKEHLYNFYMQGGVDAIMEADRNVEQYYNETFKSE